MNSLGWLFIAVIVSVILVAVGVDPVFALPVMVIGFVIAWIQIPKDE